VVKLSLLVSFNQYSCTTDTKHEPVLQIKLQSVAMDMFDLENDLPDELISSSAWNTDNEIHTNSASAGMHAYHVQNIPNDGMSVQTQAVLQHNSHMVSRGQSSLVHSVQLGAIQGSRMQVSKQVLVC